MPSYKQELYRSYVQFDAMMVEALCGQLCHELAQDYLLSWNTLEHPPSPET